MPSNANPGLIGISVDNRYHVEEKLGEGGMREVFLATDLRTGGRVVLKSLWPGMLRDDPDMKGRFPAEVLAMGRLDHPNIVKVSNVVEHEGRPFAVMQYLSGGDLETRQNPSLDEWLPQIAAALDYLHSQGLVHRDVKPANILFDAHGTPCLADFGAVKCAEGVFTSMCFKTETGMTLGTPAYMSPEAVEGKSVDGRADQYALAVIVYERLAGRLPFDGNTPARLFAAHLLTQPHPLVEIDKRYSMETSEILACAMSKQPEDRYFNCQEFAHKLLTSLQRSVGGTPPCVDDEGTWSHLLTEPARSFEPASRASVSIGSLEGKSPDSHDETVDTRGWSRHWGLASFALHALAIALMTCAVFKSSDVFCLSALLSCAIATEIALLVLPFETQRGHAVGMQQVAVALVYGLLPCVAGIASGFVGVLLYQHHHFRPGGSGIIVAIVLPVAALSISLLALLWSRGDWFRNTVRTLEAASALLLMAGVAVMVVDEPGSFIPLPDFSGVAAICVGGLVGAILAIHEFAVWLSRQYHEDAVAARRELLESELEQ